MMKRGIVFAGFKRSKKTVPLFDIRGTGKWACSAKNKALTPYMTPYIIKERGIGMSQWDKLIMRINRLSKDLRFDELRKVLESYGYEMNAPRGGSSHYTFRKQGCAPITIPKQEPIKKVYVEMVRQVVESEAKNE